MTVSENLRNWFKKEDWVRIDSQGNIAGKCGTSKNKKNPDRCLPRKKAQSLTKAERKATAAKKKRAGKKGTQFVKNTKKAKVSLKKESMDKKELKALILKTLEKEGGAAGLKALTKSSKTSEKDLKKSLSKMSGVKQHQDGDYISTPINEVETAPASMHSNDGECRCKCPAGYGTETMGSSTFQYGGMSYGASECEAACNNVSCYELEGSTTTTGTPGSGKDNIFVDKPIRRPNKPTLQKKRTKKELKNIISTPLTEVSGQIFEMLNEKLCKKGKAYVSRRKAAGEKHGAYLMGRAVKVCKGQMSGTKKKKNENSIYELKNIIRQTLEEKKKSKCKPSKGKRFAKRVDGKCRSFGQAGKAKKGGDRIRPGTAKGHAYCARSAKIKKCKNPPCANALSRKKWKCQGSRSVAEAKWTD